MKAMILAAGLGTRLHPLTTRLAKPAVPIGPRSLIEWIISHLARQGVDEIVINLHHLPETIRERVKTGAHLGVRVEYSIEEPEVLGTAGGLANAKSHFVDQDVFLLVNGDSLFELDLRAAVEAHRASGAIATMVLLPPRPGYGAVHAADGRVRSIAGRPAGRGGGDPFHFSGRHILSPRIFDWLPDGVSEINRDIYPALLDRGETIGAHIVEDTWRDLGDLASYLANTIGFLAAKGLLPDSGAVVDPSAVIEIGARVRSSIVWAGARVRAGAQLDECIVTTDAVVEPGESRRRIHMPEGVFPL